MYETENLKKSFFLLLNCIVAYHCIEEEYNSKLTEISDTLQAKEDYKFAQDFVEKDILTCFMRTFDKVQELLANETDKNKLHLLFDVWQMSTQKGYMTEIEVHYLLKLAKVWNLESTFINQVKNLK